MFLNIVTRLLLLLFNHQHVKNSHAKSEQASASSEQVKVITSVVWCESSIQSIESVKQVQKLLIRLRLLLAVQVN